MLCINTYTQDYINDCRARVDAQVAAYHDMKAGSTTANEAFEALFFNNLVLVLDYVFVHRSRTLEKKDGNPANEVRLLCQSLLDNHSKMTGDKAIKYDPAKSVLQYQVGDEIRLSEADFSRLSEAYFAEIETKYCEVGELVTA